jgi:hypothetical protein
VVGAAARSNAIVTSLFPSTVRDRLLHEDNNDGNWQNQQRQSGLHANSNGNRDNATSQSMKSKPIADLFPDCTVLFADIVNFTSWSSVYVGRLKSAKYYIFFDICILTFNDLFSCFYQMQARPYTSFYLAGSCL